jgi:hypothetical protein
MEDGKKIIYETRKDMPANKPITVGGFKWTGNVGCDISIAYRLPYQD